MEHGQDDSSNNLDSKSAEVVSSHPCTALDDDSNQDRSKGDSSEVMDSQPTQAASDDTTTSATTSTAAQEYNKADARKSIASSTSSSSSSSAEMFTEAMDAGEAPPDSSLNSSVARRGEDAATHSHASSSSLEDKLSAATLLDTHSDSNSTAPTSKNTSLAASDAVPPPPLKAAVDLHEADLAASEEVSSLPPNRPFSLQAPETPSSAVSDHYHIHKRNQPSNGDSLLKQQLDAYAQASTNGPFATTTAASNGDDGDDRDGGRWRDSVAEGTTTSAMDSVALSDADSRPSSVLLSPLMVDKANSSLANNIGSFQEVEVEGDLPTSNSDANSANAEAGPSSSSKANANGRHSHRYHEHTASNGSINSNSSKLKRSSASTPNVDGPSRQSTASSAYDYGLIQQRAESHHAELEEHPKRHRRTLRGSEDLRANFEKLREEMNTPAPANLPEDNAAKTTAGESTTIGIGTSAAQEAQVIDWDFWGEVMSDYEGVAKTRPKDLSRAIQNGIPAALRGMMWQLMSASKDPELEATYSQLMRLPSAHEKAIIRDLNRTFPTHEYFHDKAGVGQGNLLNIMKAYSLYDDEVGYCQGMAFVVGPLLLNMPDEEAFCVLVRLMKSYDLRSQYIPDMPGLQLRLYQFDRLLEELLPAVFMHLLRQGIKSSMYASQWFLTLLAYRFPLELVCSVFDLIFAEGVEAIFRFALAVMKRNEHKIVEMEFEQVLDFLKMGLFEDYKHQIEGGGERDEDAPIYSAQTFVKEALQVKITPMMLDQYASEWTDMCRQQNAQSEEVEQLRAINKKLSNQVRHLEASLSQINQEHCELVKQVVATRLEKEELEDELVRVKMALAQESLLREEGRGSIASRGSYASFGSSAGPRSPEVDRRDSQLSIPK